MSPVTILQAYHQASPGCSERSYSESLGRNLRFLIFIFIALGTAWNQAHAETVHVSISPASASLPSTLTQQFTAKVSGSSNTSVKWTVTKGSVSGAGVFTAPTVSSNTTVSVTATSVADSSVSATASVTVTPAVSVVISPASVTMNASQQQQFQATVSNTSKTQVKWSVSAGSISGGGGFTSPSVSQNTTVKVTATSVEDPSKSATATVTVMPPMAVSITPSSASVTAAATQQFTGVTQNASNSAVSWSASAGSISSTGAFTAPTVYVKTMVTVTATSVENPNKSARAQVTVNPQATSRLTVTTAGLPTMPAGVPYSITLGASGGYAPYTWSLYSGPLPTGLSLSSSGVLSGTPTQVGAFSLMVKVSDSGKDAAFQGYNLTIYGSAVGQTISDRYFGLHVDWITTPWPNIQFGTQRFWDAGVQWAEINTASGVFDWTTADERVNAAMANNADLLWDLGRTPPWAQCPNNDKSCGSGDTGIVCSYNDASEGGPGQCFPPADLATDGSGSDQSYINWVTAVATRYKGKVKYYEIWNEPTAPVMWQGSYAQLVRLTQDARCVVIGTGCNSQGAYTQKGVDPSASITTPAFVTDTGIMVSDAMSSFLSAGGGEYVDVFAYHGYVQWPKWPEFAMNDASQLQQVVVAAGYGSKPIFSTEGGFGPNSVITDADQEEAWIARYEIMMQSMGIQRAYWYAWDGALTPLWSKQDGTMIGGTTMNEMASWLVGLTLSSPCIATGTVYQCGYTGSSGYKAIAVWDTAQTCNGSECTTSTFKVPSGYTYVLNLGGSKSTVSGSTVQIGMMPVLLEN